jgi:hypothetical protein
MRVCTGGPAGDTSIWLIGAGSCHADQPNLNHANFYRRSARTSDGVMNESAHLCDGPCRLASGNSCSVAAARELIRAALSRPGASPIAVRVHAE